MCVGGVGILGFYIKIGVGMVIVEGKEYKDFDGEIYIFECGIVVDIVIVKGWKVDEFGNVIFCKMVCNFNVFVVKCGWICVCEVEEIVFMGSFDFDVIYLLGIYVYCLVQGVYEKCIEQCIMCKKEVV